MSAAEIKYSVRECYAVGVRFNTKVHPASYLNGVWVGGGGGRRRACKSVLGQLPPLWLHSQGPHDPGYPEIGVDVTHFGRNKVPSCCINSYSKQNPHTGHTWGKILTVTGHWLIRVPWGRRPAPSLGSCRPSLSDLPQKSGGVLRRREDGLPDGGRAFTAPVT